jgi:hypothetical protein
MHPLVSEVLEHLSQHSFRQNKDGIDLTLIRENLKLTPTQRLQKHNRMAKFALELKLAGHTARPRNNY